MEKKNYNNDLYSNSKQTHNEVYFTNLPIEQIKLCMSGTLMQAPRAYKA